MLSNAPQQVVALRSDRRQSCIARFYSNRQLEEQLVDFWFNHFNVFLDKGADRFWSRAMSAMRFVRTCSASSAICWKRPRRARRCCFISTTGRASRRGAGGRRNGNRPQRGLNENYARELMELHTLGVDGGYTQKDVTEVARCFTGWTIRQSAAGRRLHSTTIAFTIRARKSCWA